MTTERADTVNLQIKDRDPKKQVYFSSLLHRHARTVLPVWKSFGVTRKITMNAEQAIKDQAAGLTVRATSGSKDTYTRRMHNATEHMVAGTAAYSALGTMIAKNGHLESSDVYNGETAFLVHDAGKELEVRLVNGARAEQGTAIIDQELEKTFVQITPQDQERLEQLKLEYEERFNSENVGVRAIAGYDLASDINELRLAHAGIDPEIIEIQKEAAFTSCPTIEARVDTFNEQDSVEQRKTIQMAILHWCDDVFTTDKMRTNIDITLDGQRLNAIDDRTIKVFKDVPRNRILDEAWETDPRSTNGEGAADMQRRVGHKVEKFLADLAGVEDSLTLPAVVSQQIEGNILQTKR